MIGKITLKNFKCFQEQDFQLRGLNIFSGLNGMGKSTAMQSVLLIAQSFMQRFLPKQVILNGEYVSLGNGRDILYEDATDEVIVISLTVDNQEHCFALRYSEYSDLLEVVPPCDLATDFWQRLDYLSADRLAPQDIYPKSSYEVEARDHVGITGEYAIHYLLNHESDSVDELYLHCLSTGQQAEANIPKKTISLLTAVQEWLQVISPGVRISLRDLENTSRAQIQYYYMDAATLGNVKGNMFRPKNVGFGISYVLPVLLILLKAKKNDIILLENPEAHLHPHGQRMIGQLMAICAKNGTQLLVETHSDHVLNGIRIAVKQGLIASDCTKFFFLTKNQGHHYAVTPAIDSNGRIDEWPDGFFDEWDKALEDIL